MVNTKSPAPPSMLAVYDGRDCIGHIIHDRVGFEAFDCDDRSLGIFQTKQAALAAIDARAETAPEPDFSNQIASAFTGLRRDVRNRMRGRSTS